MDTGAGTRGDRNIWGEWGDDSACAAQKPADGATGIQKRLGTEFHAYNRLHARRVSADFIRRKAPPFDRIYRGLL